MTKHDFVFKYESRGLTIEGNATVYEENSVEAKAAFYNAIHSPNLKATLVSDGKSE